jgi:diguanylate cyclase (GGDEF)-like protein
MLLEREGILHSDGSQVDGVSRIIGFARLKDFPVVVVVTALPEEILAPWRRQLAILAGIVLAVTALSGALLLRLLRALRQNERDQAVLMRQASVDALTGLLNRRAFEDAAGREFARARRSGRTLTVFLLDLDHFKDINDTLGHAVGDSALRLLGCLLPSVLRVNDLAGRIGGEEFCVLLPEVGGESAVEVAERLRAGFAEASEAEPGLSRRVTLSVGAAEMRATDKDLEALLLRADQALYRAKAAGRDRVETASD